MCIRDSSFCVRKNRNKQYQKQDSFDDGIHPVSYTHLDVYKRQGVLAASMLFTGCSKKEESKVPDKLIVGTNAEFPPFEYMNDKKQDVYKRQGYW